MVVGETAADLRQAQAIRRRVFVEEQGIPAALDDDGLDEEAAHVLILVGTTAVATGRLVISPDGVGTLARIAVDAAHRGRGLGQRVVRQLERLARLREIERLVLQPHAELESFYEALGYHTIPGESMAGPHRLITMTKQLEPR